ncbi:MAG: hypothetical protein KDK39_19805 [Leptospiraceae bacterium]|nr:hypothetical protein [Leptospiraceae bacterium]
MSLDFDAYMIEDFEKAPVLTVPNRFYYDHRAEQLPAGRIMQYTVGEDEFYYDVQKMSPLHIATDMLVRQMMHAFRIR